MAGVGLAENGEHEMQVYKVQGKDWIVTIMANNADDAVMGLGECIASPTTLPAGLHSRWDDVAENWYPVLYSAHPTCVEGDAK